MVIRNAVKSQIVFLMQEGQSKDYICNFLGISEEVVNIVLRRIYQFENHIFVTKSLDLPEVIYFFIGKNVEITTILDKENNIINPWDFSYQELERIKYLYGFGIKLYG